MPDYHHHLNSHSLAGAAAALPFILQHAPATSLLDAGCGTGTWMRAALDAGIQTVRGVDGVALPDDQLLVPPHLRQQADLTCPWSAGPHFDLTLCLEVAEHLPASAANTLIDTLTAHSDTVAFSAACPNQPGENHLNGQWPAFWQRLFNKRGYRCDDAIRRQIWDNDTIEPWYRQNLFIATRHLEAGTEPRLQPLIHPDLLEAFLVAARQSAHESTRQTIERGSEPVTWYVQIPFLGLIAKFQRALTRSRSSPPCS